MILIALCIHVGCNNGSLPPIPAIVEGDSMAPTVCGAHLRVACEECLNEFKTEFVADVTQTVTCPNCGFGELKTGDATTVEPQSVKLQPYAGFPRRWDVVGFRLPNETGKDTGIKRIVGLPGDSIQIRQGDLYLRDKVLRKSWSLQKQVRIPVFDSKFNAVTPFDNRSRFRGRGPESGWSTRDDSVRFAKASVEDVDWFDFLNWRSCKHNGARNDEFPIEDIYGFNQQTVRELNSVDDIFVELETEFENDSTFVFAFQRGKAEFVFEITKTETQFEFKWRGSTQRKPLVFKPVVLFEYPEGLIEFSSFDRTLSLRINGATVFELREDEATEQVAELSVFEPKILVPFRLGGESGMFRVNRIRIWRDLYYLPAPAGFAAKENLKLDAGPNEYIVLGDNCPKSLDSRTWEKAGIALSDIIGKLIFEESAD
jgi:signal peptidase I